MLTDRRWRMGIVAALPLASLVIRIAEVETTSYRSRSDAAAAPSRRLGQAATSRASRR